MLQSFRNIANTWAGKILGVFLILGLAGFGITGVLTSLGSNTIVRVGDQEVSLQDFQRAYSVQTNNMSNQLGQALTPDMAVAFGIPSSVINQLATDAALSELASQMGLGVSQERLAENLAQDPSFSGLLGSFDRDVFTQVLSNNGLTENQYFDQRRAASGREQVALGMFRLAHVPQTAVDIANRFGNDTRTISYFTFGADTLLPIDPASDEVLQAYLEERQSVYVTQESRDITLLLLSPETIADKYDVTEDELAAEYERRSATLFRPETRAIEQVVLPAQATVSWFETGQANGKSFETLVEEAALTTELLGEFTQTEMTDQGLAEAVFAIKEGEFALIEGAMGMRAVHVIEVQEAGTPTFEDVADELTQALKISKARTEYLDILDVVEETRAALAPLATIAEQNGLSSVEVSIFADGSGLPENLDADEKARIANAVFSAGIGGLTPSVPLSSESNAWFEIAQIHESREQTLEEIRDELAQDWMNEQRTLALQEKADQFVASLQGASNVDDIAIMNGLFPQITEPFNRGGNEAISNSAAAAAFEGGIGYANAIALSAEEQLVFVVTDILPSEVEPSENEIGLIENSFRDSSYGAFVTGLRDRYGMIINEELLASAIGLDTTN